MDECGRSAWRTRKRTDQLGVDECEIDCIALLVALWPLHRRRLDDALPDSARILDVLELGGENDRVDEFGAAIDFEELHGRTSDSRDLSDVAI